jgi:hypothetical protein
MTTTEIVMVSVPNLTVLVGIVLNQNGTNRLDSRIEWLDSRLSAEMKTCALT